MNVLRDGRSERGTARVGKRHDLKTVRWYVHTLPTTGVARRDRISPAKSLDAELSRRKRRGETLFEYFAPSYVEVRKLYRGSVRFIWKISSTEDLTNT